MKCLCAAALVVLAGIVSAAAQTYPARFTELGVAIPPRQQQTPDGLRAHHQAELDKWRPIIEAAHIKPE